MSTDGGIQLLSPSKVNLFLEVLGKRDDGFHELETVMLRTSLCDRLLFEANTDSEIRLRLASSSGAAEISGIPLDESNLIVRAAMALRVAAGVALGADITLCKNIPAEAGLAGGSANAATTLTGLNQLWSLGLQKESLHEIAATLGSDVNFFIEETRSAVCRGRGEIVSSVPMAGSLWLVIARPFTGNSTPRIFAALPAHSEARSARNIVSALKAGQHALINRLAFNRLTPAACELNPEMSDLLHQMQDICGRPAFMSGSGSTCFVIARSRRESTILRRRLVRLKTSFLACVQVR